MHNVSKFNGRNYSADGSGVNAVDEAKTGGSAVTIGVLGMDTGFEAGVLLTNVETLSLGVDVIADVVDADAKFDVDVSCLGHDEVLESLDSWRHHVQSSKRNYNLV